VSKERVNNAFKVGQRVWLPNTQEIAVITRIEKEGLIYVDADGINIPVFISDISADIPDELELPDSMEAEDLSDENHNETKEVKNTGVYVLFVPEQLHDGEIIHYNCFVLNDTYVDVELQFEVFTDNDVFEEGEMILSKGERKQITHFNPDVLNDIDEVELFMVPFNERYEPFHFRQKISATSFMRKLKYFTPLQQDVSVYEVLKKFKDRNTKQPALVKEGNEFSFDADVVKRMMTEKSSSKDSELSFEHNIDVDLHTEAFLNDISGMDNAAILHAQIERFSRALDMAIGSGQKIFYAIHGNGKGKLRKEIENILKNNEFVSSYNNSYHPRYGFGATEILLK
jgi:hypothetical protein